MTWQFPTRVENLTNLLYQLLLKLQLCKHFQMAARRHLEFETVSKIRVKYCVDMTFYYQTGNFDSII